MSNKLTILQALSKVTDKRRKEGKRHNLVVILLINIMATMSGYLGVRSKEDFVKRNKESLTKLFNPLLLKHGLPSKNTIDRTMQSIDYQELNQALTLVIDPSKVKTIHIDGKAIKGTVKNSQNQKQTFTSIVSAFSEGKVITSKEFLNGSKTNEINTVQELVQKLGINQKVITLDSLHAQKKQ